MLLLFIRSCSNEIVQGMKTMARRVTMPLTKKKNLLRNFCSGRLIGLLLLLLLGLVPADAAVSAPAANTEILKIKKERQNVELTLKKLKKQLEEYQAKISTTKKQESQSLKALENIRRQILVLEKLIRENQRYLVVLDDDIDSLNGALHTNRRTYARVSDDFRRTAVSVYKHGRQRDTEQLFSSGSVNEALLRSKYMGFFSRAVRGDVEKLQYVAVQLENNRAELQKSYQEKAAVVRDQEQQLKTYSQKGKEKEVVLEKLRQNKKQYGAQLATVMSKRRQLQSKIEGLIFAEQRAVAEEKERQRRIQEARRLEAQRLEAQRLEAQRQEARRAEAQRLERERLQGQQQGSGSRQKDAAEPVAEKTDQAVQRKSAVKKTSKQKPESRLASRNEATVVPDVSSQEIEKVSADFDRAFGSLPWPVRGGVVAERFGSVEDRDLRIVKTNNGIDISVPVGTSVRAVSGGKVVQIAFLPTFGNIVIIRHPNSYLTVYANLGSLSVAKNELIRSQQMIGVSGKMPEGGSVVHFEIWKGKVKQNPEKWLRR